MKATIKAVALATLLSAPGHASAACLQQETENNNTESKANSGLCSGQTVNGSIGSSSDIDWYKFDTTSTGDISVSLNHGSSADFDFICTAAAAVIFCPVKAAPGQKPVLTAQPAPARIL